MADGDRASSREWESVTDTYATPCLRCGRMLSFTINPQKEGSPIVVEKCECEEEEECDSAS